MEYTITAFRRTADGNSYETVTVKREYDEAPESGSIIRIEDNSYAIISAIPDHHVRA